MKVQWVEGVFGNGEVQWIEGAVCGGGIIELEAVWCWGGQCEVYGEMCSARSTNSWCWGVACSGSVLGRVAVVVCWGVAVVVCWGVVSWGVAMPSSLQSSHAFSRISWYPGCQ